MHTHANHYARQQQQLRRDEWRSRPDRSLSMHVQVDGIEFNHRNDRPFFFGARGSLHEWFVVTWGSVIDAPRGRASKSVEKDKGKPPLSEMWVSGESRGCCTFPESSHSLSSLPPDPCLKELIPLLIQLKWSYLSHPDISVISGQQCCWMRHLSKALERCSGRCNFFCLLKWNAVCTLNYMFVHSFNCWQFITQKSWQFRNTGSFVSSCSCCFCH